RRAARKADRGRPADGGPRHQRRGGNQHGGGESGGSAGSHTVEENAVARFFASDGRPGGDAGSAARVSGARRAGKRKPFGRGAFRASADGPRERAEGAVRRDASRRLAKRFAPGDRPYRASGAGGV